MPEAEILFRIREEGSVAEVATRMQAAMARIQQTSVETNKAMSSMGGMAYWGFASDQIDAYVKSADRAKAGSAGLAEAGNRASLSFRTLRMGVSDLAMSIGAANPEIATIALGLGHVTERMAGLSGGAAILGVGILAAGAGVAFLSSKFEEWDKASEFQVKLNDSVRRFDTSGMQGQLRAVSLELETLAAKGKSWWRSITLSPGFAAEEGFAEEAPVTIGDITQAKRIEDLTKQREDLQRAIEKTVDLEAQENDLRVRSAIRTAQYEQAVDPAARAEERVRAETDAAKQIIDIRQKRDMASAESDEDLLKVENAHRLERQLAEEQGQAKILAIRRAAAKQYMDEQTSLIKDQLSQQQAVLGMQVAAGSAGRSASLGMYLGTMTEDQRSRFGSTAENAATAANLEAIQSANKAREDALQSSQIQIEAMLLRNLSQDLISQRDYNDKVRAMDQELTMAKLQNLQQYQTAVVSALNKAVSDYQKYTDQVRALDKEIQSTKRGTADSIAEMQQAGMTPAEAFADKERRANEALAEAMNQTGQDQVESLRRVQEAYKSLGLEAARSAQEQKAAKDQADAFNLPLNDWRTSAGQHSQAYNMAWNQNTPGGAGSAEWWAGKGNDYWSTVAGSSSAKATAESMANKVKTVGDLIVEAQSKQRAAAADSATQAERMVVAMTEAANQAVRLAQTLAAASAASAAAAASAPMTPTDYQGILSATADRTAADVRGGNGISDVGGVPISAGESTSLSYDLGGIIPGPAGQAKRVTVHAGEGVFTPDQMRALARLGGGSNQPTTLIVHVGGIEVGRAIIPAINRGIESGSIRLRGQG